MGKPDFVVATHLFSVKNSIGHTRRFLHIYAAVINDNALISFAGTSYSRLSGGRMTLLRGRSGRPCMLLFLGRREGLL